jgi:ADP-ribose pyrophosphatase
VYLAKNLKPGKQHLDEGEFIDVKAYDIQELFDMIYAGKLQDSKTVAGILAYANRCKN